MSKPSGGFPSAQIYGGAMFKEAVRHCNDGVVLWKNGRYAASVASSLKAVELASKGVAIIEGASGWWDKLHNTHDPMTQMKGHLVLKEHYDRVESAHSGLSSNVILLEKHNPSKPGGLLDEVNQANPEYPFFYVDTSGNTALTAPSSYYLRVTSRKHVNTSIDYLRTICELYAKFSRYGRSLPKTI